MFFNYFAPNANAVTDDAVPIVWSEKPIGQLNNFFNCLIRNKLRFLSTGGYSLTQ